MPSASDIRRLAFQALFQLDARGQQDIDAVRDQLEDDEVKDAFSKTDCDKAFDLAVAAYEARAAADAEMEALAPTWPASRQAAVDRAILRLAHHEMTVARAPAKVVINEAVELAKEFSTDKSPAFINGLLDKVFHRLHPDATADAPTSPDAEPRQPPEST